MTNKNNQRNIILTILGVVLFCFYVFKPISAVSPTPAPDTETENATSSSITEEKIKEFRDYAKEEVSKIKEKIEKRAYVGTIIQITDSTLTLENFRGKRRVRLAEETTIIATNKKEIKAKDLALEDKVIAMGTMGSNEILEAVRVVVTKPTVNPSENTISLGIIISVNAKTSRIKFSDVKNQTEIEIKVEKETKIMQYPASSLKFSDLEENQKIIVVHPKAKEAELPLAKSIYLLP
ncbi:hypothetical protein KKA69_02645 [Patescibacteria group bacterium]|nr:hypothetical protein [Patescibacteria group bacterium]